MKQFFAVAACISLALVSSAYARKAVLNDACALTEQINLTVNYNITGGSFAEVKTKYDEKIKTVEQFAKKQGTKKFDLQSMNYNINSNNYNGGEGGVQLSGSATYQMDSADNAFKLAEFLTAQKFQVSMNANSYHNGNCNNTITE